MTELENYIKEIGETPKQKADELIEKLGRRLNYLKKGNLVDDGRTARHILREWQEGKIRV